VVAENQHEAKKLRSVSSEGGLSSLQVQGRGGSWSWFASRMCVQGGPWCHTLG
jgi:hypothetical protein